MSEFDRTLDLLKGLNRQLDEYERTRDANLLNNLQDEIKMATPQLERVVKNPEYKSTVDADRFFEFKDEFKRLIERSKAYGILGNTAAKEEEKEKEKENPRYSKKRHSQFGLTGIMSSFRGGEGGANGGGDSNGGGKGSSYSSSYSNINFGPGEIDLMEVRKLVEVTARPKPMKGWLRKQGEDLFKVFKRRWFEQRQWKLEYFRSDQRTASSDALGNIEFASMQRIEILREPKYGFHLCTDFRLFVLQAETQQEFEEIIRGIVEWKSYFDYEHQKLGEDEGEKKGGGLGMSEGLSSSGGGSSPYGGELGSLGGSNYGGLGGLGGLGGSAYGGLGGGIGKKGKEENEGEEKGESEKVEEEEEEPLSSRATTPMRELEGEEERAMMKEKKIKGLLAEKEKQLVAVKAQLDAANEANQEDRAQKKNLESDLSALQTRYEVEKRTWKEERHKREEEAADVRREMASLMASQRTTEDENVRLKTEMRGMEELITQLKEDRKKGGGGGGGGGRLSMRMASENADELKKVKTELIILQQHEKEERISRRQVEEERDVLQEKLEVEVRKRERGEERRREEEQELGKVKAEVEAGKRQIGELEGVIARMEKKESELVQQVKEAQVKVELAGKMVEKTKEELGDKELQGVISNLVDDVGLSSEQVGKVVKFVGQYLGRYSELEGKLYAAERRVQEADEEGARKEGQLREVRKEYEKLLKEYEAKDQYVNALKAKQGGGGGGQGGGKAVEKLREELENMQERCLASQSQAALLSHQLTLAGGESEAKLAAKEKTIGGLRKELGDLRKQYQDLREGVLLRGGGASEVELEQLSNIKQELFVNLAVFTKMNLAANGVHCNLHVLDLYEEAKDLDYREWKAWIHARYQEGAGGTRLARDYTRSSSRQASFNSSGSGSSSGSLPASSGSLSSSSSPSSSPSASYGTSAPSSSSSSSSSRQSTSPARGNSTTKLPPKKTTKTTTTKTKSTSPRPATTKTGSGEVKKVKKVVKKKKPTVVDLGGE